MRATAGRVVLVTGASSGIGRATALAFARRGATVVGVARREERLREVMDACRVHAPESLALPGDLSERSFAEGVVRDAFARCGRLDVLVNNAGTALHRSIYRTRPEDVERVLRVNFLSAVWTTLEAIPGMLRQGGGTIVNVSSVAARLVPPREAAYAASKAALAAFSEGLWSDLHGSGIHVALVHPGPIDTEIWSRRDDPGGYTGPRHPPERVAEVILHAVEARRFELTAPRFAPRIALARWLRFLWPGLVRRAMRGMDPPDAVAAEPPRGPES